MAETLPLTRAPGAPHDRGHSHDHGQADHTGIAGHGVHHDHTGHAAHHDHTGQHHADIDHQHGDAGHHHTHGRHDHTHDGHRHGAGETADSAAAGRHDARTAPVGARHAQAVPPAFSLLRLSFAERLGAALVATALIWLGVAWAML